ncbi:16S rRNA (guanine(527)-N(7))-methyltransferase RsmG [Congregibacter litoralis]|uniref:Ribosomal RNA small subunit methyltransferase G n=1 Tax=Congregibacter litoralis KT71 TaxID=314285 RepID=A4A963_9GAMM|nr:16S rRNA (guanine(527)-N(7))-methyltransferase RsmG [Congregibacter litoralis]EAQ97605.1 methyltransferase [Congregibacter litoralis KT71]
MEKALRLGLEDLGLDLSEEQQELLLQYLKLLSRWNKAYNLTAIRDEAVMVTKHLLDSLAVLPHLRGQRFIDVGTGAGLPGIPLAIALPDKHFSLLDSNGKKTRFLTHAANELSLDNVEIVKSRVADFVPGERYDAVLSRAFASLDAMISGCEHLLLPSGEFLAMKGQRPDDELERIDCKSLPVSITDLDVPGLPEYRCLLRIGPKVNLDLQ